MSLINADHVNGILTNPPDTTKYDASIDSVNGYFKLEAPINASNVASEVGALYRTYVSIIDTTDVPAKNDDSETMANQLERGWQSFTFDTYSMTNAYTEVTSIESANNVTNTYSVMIGNDFNSQPVWSDDPQHIWFEPAPPSNKYDHYTSRGWREKQIDHFIVWHFDKLGTIE